MSVRYKIVFAVQLLSLFERGILKPVQWLPTTTPGTTSST